MKDRPFKTVPVDDELLVLRHKAAELEHRITELRRVTDGLRDKEALWRRIVDAIPYPVFVKDEEGRFLAANRALAEVFGKEPLELLGKEATRFHLDQENHAKLVKQNKEVLESGRTCSIPDLIFPDHLGRERVYQTTKMPLRWPDPPHSAVLGVAVDVTEKREADKALRRGKMLLSAGERLAHLGAWEWDLEEDRFSLSEGWLRIHGCTTPPVNRSELHGFAHPDDLDAVILAEEEAIRTKRTYDFENRIIRQNDGETRYVRAVGEIVQNESGVPVRMIGVVQDITDRKRAEDALRKSEARYRHLVEHAPAGIFEVDFLENKFITVNDVMCRYTGYSREELLAMDPMNILSEESKFLLLQRLKALFDGREVEEHQEFQIRTKDGKRVWIGLNAQYVYEGGVVRGATVVAHSLDERKRAEEALRLSEQRYRRLVEKSPDIIFRFSNRRGGLYWSARVEEILGYPPDYVRLHPWAWYRSIHQDDRPRVDQAVAEGPEGTDSGVEYRVRDVQGRWHWFRERFISREILDGEIIVEGLATDITDRKEAEEERVAMDRRLYHAQKLESLGLLAGGIAHDFNNLLMAVLGNLDVAAMESSESARAHIEKAAMAARRAADLTRQMLAYSGQGRFFLRELDFNNLVSETVSLLRAGLPKKVKLRMKLGKRLHPFPADEGQLRQVVMNLVTNAAEAAGERGGVVTLTTDEADCDATYLSRTRTDETPQPGRFVRLEVHDDGSGMNAHTLERLFDPFFTTKFMGRGLGMAAVLGIIKGHGGAVMVESEEGKGTSVRVLFPLNAEVSETAGTALSPSPLTDNPDYPDGSGTILVVDDEEMVLDICSAMVKRAGFQVFTASDGEEALQVFSQHGDEIDGVILDLYMPRMDGVATFEELRRLRPDMKIILSSGYGEEEATRRFSGRGLSGFLQKPYELRKLYTELERVFGPAASRPEATP